MEQALRGVREALSEMTHKPKVSKVRAGPRIGRCESVCLLSDAHHSAYSERVQSSGRLLPNVRSVDGIAGSSEVELLFDNDSSTKFRATSFLNDASKDQVYEASCSKALNWILSGYNVNVVTTGHAGSGKSSTLFGQSGRHGQIHVLLNNLYKFMEQQEQKRNSGSDGDASKSAAFTVGLSMWELAKDRVTDLLAPVGADGQPPPSEEATDDHLLKVVSVRSETFSTAVALLTSGMARSTNFCAQGHDQLVRPNRAHLFLRIALHNADTRNLSLLHVIDLIGDVPEAGGVPIEPQHKGQAGERDYYSRDPEFARFSLRQATSFAQMISELADASVTTGETGLNALSSHQSSALNRLAAPVLSGNAKTIVLEHISPCAFFHHDAVRTLGLGQKALNINTICRQLPVPADALQFLDSTVALNQSPAKPTPGASDADVGSQRSVREAGGASSDEDSLDASDDDANDRLMEALYSSPKNKLDAQLEPLKPQTLTRQQREELGIFVSDAASQGTQEDELDTGVVEVSDDDDANTKQSEAGDLPQNVGGSQSNTGGTEHEPDASEVAAEAREDATRDVQQRIDSIDALLSEIQSSQQSYSSKKNRIREEINAVVDEIVGGGAGPVGAQPVQIPQDPQRQLFQRTAEHARERQAIADAKIQAETEWLRQQQELELAASVARNAARGGVHSISPPVTAASLAGPRVDPSTGVAGWGASPPPHLRPNLQERETRPPTEHDPEDIGEAAAHGAVASMYERHMENLSRVQQRHKVKKGRQRPHHHQQRADPAPITMENTVRGHWGNQVVMPDGFVGAANADNAVPGVNLYDTASEPNESSSGEAPVKGAAYYAALLEQQRRAADSAGFDDGNEFDSQPLQSDDYVGVDLSGQTGAGQPEENTDTDSGTKDAGPGSANYFRQKIAAHVAESEANEAAAEYELRITDLRGENLKLRSDLRTLKQQSGFSEVFRRYEADLEASRREVGELRKANAKLETSLDAQIVRQAMSKGRGNTNIKDDAVSDASKKIKTRLRNLRAEVLTLREQISQWQLKDRTFALHKRCLADATKKSRKLARRCEAAETENSGLKSANSALREEVVQLRARCGGLEQERRELDFENRKASLEVKRLRQAVDDMAHRRNRAGHVSGVADAIERNPYRPTMSYRNQDELPQDVRNCLQRLHRSVSRYCPRSLHTLALLKEHMEKMQTDVRSTILREEQLLDLMIEFVQRGERKDDIQYLLKLREQQLRDR